VDYKIISADGHMDLFYLPPDTFTSRAPTRLKDRVPHVVDIKEKPMWVGDGAVMGGYQAWMGRGGTTAFSDTSYRGQRMSDAGWDPTHPSNPKLRLGDLDIDGIEAEVIYGIRFVEDSIKEADVITATYRAYNDFIAEFCSHNPQRLIGIGDIPAHSVVAAAEEIRRIGRGGLGLRGALFDWFNAPQPMAFYVGTHVGCSRGVQCGTCLPYRCWSWNNDVRPNDCGREAEPQYSKSIHGSAPSRGSHAG